MSTQQLLTQISKADISAIDSKLKYSFNCNSLSQNWLGELPPRDQIVLEGDLLLTAKDKMKYHVLSF